MINKCGKFCGILTHHVFLICWTHMELPIRYLGHVVSRQGIQADPEKTSSKTSIPVIKELSQFLELTNYYHRFIKDGYKWNTEYQNAFECLKQLLIRSICIPTIPFTFYSCYRCTDCAIGAVLSQEKEGEEKVTAHWSRQLKKAERNYSTIERETLAVVNEFSPYLYGNNLLSSQTIILLAHFVV